MRGAAIPVGVPLALLLTALLYYASPWWPWATLCARDGLLGDGGRALFCAREGVFGIGALHPRGDWVARWLRDAEDVVGLPLLEFALLVWLLAAFGLLTLLQRLWDAMVRPAH